jgi:hypothetical protein
LAAKGVIWLPAVTSGCNVGSQRQPLGCQYQRTRQLVHLSFCRQLNDLTQLSRTSCTSPAPATLRRALRTSPRWLGSPGTASEPEASCPCGRRLQKAPTGQLVTSQPSSRPCDPRSRWRRWFRYEPAFGGVGRQPIRISMGTGASRAPTVSIASRQETPLQSSDRHRAAAQFWPRRSISFGQDRDRRNHGYCREA